MRLAVPAVPCRHLTSRPIMPPDAAHAPLHPSDRRWSLSHAVAAWIADLGDMVITWVAALGDIMMFGGRTFLWLVSRMPRRETLLPNFYQIGVLSLPVVALTGTFIGMVLAVQSYAQFRILHLETRLGAIINMSLVRELGPVLAATMLAGRWAAPWPPSWARCASPSRSTPCRAWGPTRCITWSCPVFWLPGADSHADDHGRLHGRGRRLVLQHATVGHRQPSYWENSQAVRRRVRLFSAACLRACSSARRSP